MRLERHERFFLFLMIMLLCAFPALQQTKKEAQDKSARTSLIRKELLSQERWEPRETLRNIFTPHSSRSSVAADLAVNPQQDEIPDSDQQMSPEYRFSLQYIGFISSGKELVALIFLEGEAYAVKQGEMLAEDVSVGKITPEAIEIIGPGSETRKYSREGEKR